MSKRIRLWLIAALALCAAAAVGVTLSFMFKKAEKTNTFVPAAVTCEVEESLFSGVKSNVCVKNTGNAAAYLRIRLVSYYVYAKCMLTAALQEESPPNILGSPCETGGSPGRITPTTTPPR